MTHHLAATRPSPLRELLFQMLLHGLVFVFYSFDQHQTTFQPYKLAFFLNYVLAAGLINYLWLPRFLYPKQYLLFALGVTATIALTIAMEEFVLERIFFPDTRGKVFPGVFASLLDVLPVIAILSGFKFGWDALRTQREVDALRTAMAESELQFLKSQINPHFLFNNLNNLYSYALTRSPKTPEIILELSEVLRYMLYDCREAYVPLAKELEQLTNFTRLNELHIEGRGEVRLDLPDQTFGYRVAPLILIVFIENAFKHSQAQQSSGILIDISATLSPEGELVFHCRNSFQPRQKPADLPHGIGLANVRKRLGLIYPGQHRLDIRQETGTYEVELHLQLSRHSG
ncbi:MAG: histidine kinase [Bacteroidetes bacterium]|nr:MAG: histidine kinase [Bacteroidota bacterium]